jgi:hypothetical protein
VNVLKLLTIVSASIWLGAIIFFSGFVAPLAFSVLDRESAGRFVSSAFPRYHLFGIVLGLLALVGVVGRFRGGRESPWGALVLVLVMLGISAFVLLVLIPQLDALRAAGARSSPAFARLHGFSVVLNLVTMLAGFTLLFIEAFRGRS